MDRIYDLLRGVESAIKNQTEATILPVPVVDINNLPEVESDPGIKPELVDETNNTTELNKQKEVVNKLKNTNPDESVSVPNGDTTIASFKFKVGDKVRNTNTSCMHYGSEGLVTDTEALPDHIGCIVGYKTTNAGPNWTVDQYLRKTEDQLTPFDSFDDYGLAEEENESVEDEMMEYKNDFLEMNIGSLRAIMTHAQHILDAMDNESVKENLTESWLQGKIAITEDYMRTIHDFVMYVSEDDDEMSTEAKRGLWDNIRRKKDREGKNYKPAKPGDKDRPDPKMWKKLTKDSKKSE